MSSWMPSSADYIIVGGGVAGCTLASRLSHGDPDSRVVLIEAGQDPAGHPFTSTPAAAISTHFSDLDWAYTTVPQTNLSNRKCYAAAAKSLSGGSATNHGVWSRGAAADYDRWAAQVGDKKWDYENLLPYFRQVETHYDERADDEQHGFDGPIHTASVTESNRHYPLHDPIRNAWSQIGVDYNADANGGESLGMSELVETWRDGKRQLVNKAYDLSRVQVLTQTLVQRVVVEDVKGSKVATGVQLADGRVMTASKEIIVSAGAYRTPQVLMLSGIGPAAELAKCGIATVVNSPEVGQNFHDHLGVNIWWKLQNPERDLAEGAPGWKDPSFTKGMPTDWLVSQHTPKELMKEALVADNDSKDSQGLLNASRCHTETLTTYAPNGIEIANMKIPYDGSYITTTISGMAPTSRGRITISSSNPSDAPVIDPNYYSTAADRVALRHGVRQVLRMLQDTPTGQKIVSNEEPPKGFTNLHWKLSSDGQIDERVKRVANSAYHAGGTAAMGKVVDTELKVKGVQGLRVCDASVLPVPIGAHYQATVHAVGEVGADLILKA